MVKIIFTIFISFLLFFVIYKVISSPIKALKRMDELSLILINNFKIYNEKNLRNENINFIITDQYINFMNKADLYYFWINVENNNFLENITHFEIFMKFFLKEFPSDQYLANIDKKIFFNKIAKNIDKIYNFSTSNFNPLDCPVLVKKN